MTVLICRLNLLMDTGKTYKLGTQENWPIQCVRQKELMQDEMKMDDTF